MSLLSDHDREAVRARLGVITEPITLLFFTQTFAAPETALIARRIVGELATLTERVTVEELNLVLDKDRAAQYGISVIPAIAILRNGADTGIRFLGAPGGYEFMSLVDAIVIAGTGESGLSAESKSLIAEHVTEPLHIQVFVTPTCPHCPRAVTLAHRMALESAHIDATCVEATEFIELSHEYRVTGVPKTVASNGVELLGAVAEDEFVRAILRLPRTGGVSAASTS